MTARKEESGERQIPNHPQANVSHARPCRMSSPGESVEAPLETQARRLKSSQRNEQEDRGTTRVPPEQHRTPLQLRSDATQR